MSTRFAFLFVLAAVGSLTASVRAITIPFTETFNAGSSNWFDSAGLAPATWNSSGGVDGSGYVSTTFNFVDQSPSPFPNNAVNLFRAQDEYNSSSHGFEGDWLSSGVTQFTFWVRHHAPTPMNFFARFSTASNFPAWSGVEFTPIAPETWTPITIDISFANPNLFFEGPPPTLANFSQVFGSIGHVQIGVFGGSMAGVDQNVTFDLDDVSIIPVPSAFPLLALLFARRSRKRRGLQPNPSWSAATSPPGFIEANAPPTHHRQTGFLLRAFSMVELLVVITVVSLLTGLVFAALRSVKESTHKTVELNAARHLMTAYINYAAVHNDKLLPGYASQIPVDPGPNDVVHTLMAYDAAGQPITGSGNPPLDIARKRYLWRLAPYLSYDLHGLYTNQQQDLLERIEANDHRTYLYLASISPSLGLNSEWVGGDDEYGFRPVGHIYRQVIDYNQYYLTAMAQAFRPDQLIVFASARGVDPESSNPNAGRPVEGYFKVKSPYFAQFSSSCRWSAKFDAGSDPVTYGYLSPRYANKAVIGFLDGHANALDTEQLRDMRHWANAATAEDWCVPPAPQ